MEILPKGRFRVPGLAFKALHSSTTAHLTSLFLTFPLPHSHDKLSRFFIPLHKVFLQSAMPLLSPALLHPEHSFSNCKTQLRDTSSKKLSLISWV